LFKTVAGTKAMENVILNC